MAIAANKREFNYTKACVLILVVMATMVFGLVFAAGQDLAPMAADAHPSFEVATIKPTDPSETSQGFQIRGRRVVVLNETLDSMISFAFAVHQEQIVGGPGWFATDRYDINGIPDAEGVPNTKQMQEMVRRLLQNRFSIRFHREKRKLSIYAIRVAKNGPKLERSKANPGALPDEYGDGDGHHGFRIRCKNNSMSDLALELQFVMDRPVLDETGLTARYDFVLDWNRNETPSNDPNTPPDIFTAMQEQLGLKLEPKKDLADVIVIDHAERPSEN